MPPRVTVILSTYNWSSVLPFSIGSVLRQTFCDWELLVIGDGCTDDSEAVVREVARTDAAGRIRWINLPVNVGNQFGPNNEGLIQARGELIAYLGHDDLWLPHHLSSLTSAIDSGAEVAHTVVKWVDPTKTGEGPFPPDQCVPPSSVMHRRAATDAVGGWRDFRELSTPPDDDLWTRFRRAGLTFAFVPRLTVVKFPATVRRDVYKTKPSHEQAAWFARIGAEPDFEAVELSRMLCATHAALFAPGVRQAGAIAWREVRKVAQRLRRPRKKGAAIRAWRSFKGLENN